MPPETPEVFEDITCEAGKPLELRIPFKGGKPKPTAELLKDGEPAEFDDCEVMEDEVVFQLKKPVHAHSGNYVAKLKNPFGEADCKGNIKVLDRPDPPEELEISEVTKETASLQWRAPVKDGGSPVIGYNIERKDHKRGNWVPMESGHPAESYKAKKLG